MKRILIADDSVSHLAWLSSIDWAKNRLVSEKDFQMKEEFNTKKFAKGSRILGAKKIF